tara:strand:+ start:515 stop:1201 length:687 start_codon:yes stop_codon:yes gene_type:complete
MFPIRDTNKTQTFPIVNWIIIVLNILVFYFQINLPTQSVEQIFTSFGIVPVKFLIMHPLAPISLLSSQFIHSGWVHIIRNLWVLYIFGDNVEDKLGHLQYLVFYLTCGIIGGVLHIVIQPYSHIPMIGASGAISGVLGAYMLFFPKARILTFVPIFIIPWLVKIPAVIYLGIWFLSQLSDGLSTTSSVVNSGIAYWAHLGGFIAGFLLSKHFRKNSKYRKINTINNKF